MENTFSCNIVFRPSAANIYKTKLEYFLKSMHAWSATYGHECISTTIWEYSQTPHACPVHIWISTNQHTFPNFMIMLFMRHFVCMRLPLREEHPGSNSWTIKHQMREVRNPPKCKGTPKRLTGHQLLVPNDSESDLKTSAAKQIC